MDLRKSVKTEDYEGKDRRDIFSSMDLGTKIILSIIALVNGLMGWGVRELFTTLRTHEKEITILQIENKNQSATTDMVKNEHINNISRLTRIEEKQLSFEGKLEVLSTGISSKLVSIESKLDRIVETGILDHNKNGREKW